MRCLLPIHFIKNIRLKTTIYYDINLFYIPNTVLYLFVYCIPVILKKLIKFYCVYFFLLYS